MKNTTHKAPRVTRTAGSLERVVRPKLPRTQRELDRLIYRELTVQLLRLHNEVFFAGGMSQGTFANEYLNGIGRYERRVAREEGIQIKNWA